MSNQFPKKITGITEISFSVDEFALYGIIVTARAQSGKQDLRVDIDTLKLRELPPKDKPQYNNIPPSWNGTELKGLAKTIIFILKLNKGEHTLKFVPTQEAIIDGYKIEPVFDTKNIRFNLETQAEDGNRRPWITVVLVDLALNKFTAEFKLKRRFIDSDDVKVIVDGTIKRNNESILHKFWYFIASIFKGETQTETFTENLSVGLHYIEFWADRMPNINYIQLDLGQVELKRIPTVDDPVWTGDFNDDTEEMLMARLILGEGEGQPNETKLGISFTVINRLKKQNTNWGLSIKEIILKEDQYDGMWNELTYEKVRNPLKDSSEKRLREWQEIYKLAVDVISGNLSDPTEGATNFHSYTNQTMFPPWATEERFRIKLGSIYFYELEK